LVTLEPTGLSGKDPSISQTDQFGFVVSGVLELTLGDDVVRLRRGDAVQILAGIPNRWVNQSSRPAQFVLVSFRRSR
jgi:quercetin dioxygenase-like cupin family protein